MLRFRLPDSISEIEVKEEVMRLVEQSTHFKAHIVEGMGLRFTDISEVTRSLSQSMSIRLSALMWGYTLGVSILNLRDLREPGLLFF